MLGVAPPRPLLGAGDLGRGPAASRSSAARRPGPRTRPGRRPPPARRRRAAGRAGRPPRSAGAGRGGLRRAREEHRRRHRQRGRPGRGPADVRRRPPTSATPSPALVCCRLLPSQAGRTARTTAPCMPSATAWVNVTDTSTRPAARSPARTPDRQRPRDAAGVVTPLGPVRRAQPVLGDDVGHPDPPTGAQHAGDLGEHRGLVRGQVDDAVADDHVHRGVRQRDVLDGAAQHARRSSGRPRPRCAGPGRASPRSCRGRRRGRSGRRGGPTG